MAEGPPAPPDLEAELDRLFALPLGEFVDARSALAARLKASRDKEGSARIKALKRPSPAAWAVNQLRFRAPDVLDALLAAGDELRSASPAGFREAMQTRKNVLAAARRRAGELLEAAGQAASSQTMQRVASTLEALATYGSAPGHPVPGRLVEELEPPGLEEIAALALPLGLAGGLPAKEPDPVPAAPPSPPAPPPPAPLDFELHRARERTAAARRGLDAAARDVDVARTRLDAALDGAVAARRVRENAERELESARAREAAQEATVGAAREALRSAEATMGVAKADLDEAETDLAGRHG